MPRLAENYTVVAPDLIGHGRSAKPRGDYSLGAYAAGVRDLLAVLGFERATVVGHSFGGGIAMQFSYLFPEYVERMALIASGGLGKEVHPMLRAAALPGSEWVLPLLAREWSVKAGDAVRSVGAMVGIEAGPDIAEFARGYASLVEEGASDAFIHTMRRVIDHDGQRVSALDRLYLADQMPTLIVWGDNDPIIPVEHGRNAHRIVEHSRYVEIPGSGHWPMLDAPDRIVQELTEFMEETEPFQWSLETVRDRLRRGPQPAPEAIAAGTHKGGAMLSADLLGASTPPAGGAATSDVIYATAGAVVVTILLMGPILLYKQGRFPVLGRLAALAERVTGLPGWAALPGTFLAVTLLIAVFGMYWDISLHIDQGRDPGPLANPAHYFILAGLFGVLVAGRARPRPLRQADPHLVRDRARLARADRRADDHDLRRELAARLPARRHLAPDLRPGRDALGADPPDADRRRLALGARRLGAARRGR